MRIGDMKLSQRQTAQANTVRGVLLEITLPNIEGTLGEKATEDDASLLRNLLGAIFSNSKLDLKMDEIKLLARYIDQAPSGPPTEKEAESGNKRKKPSQWALAGLYMEMLRSRT